MMSLFGDYYTAINALQFIFISGFMICGLIVCCKKSQPKHNLHVINLNQAKAVSSQQKVPSSRKSQSYHSKTRTRKSSHHSRTRSKNRGSDDENGEDRPRRHRSRGGDRKKKDEESGSEKKIEKQQPKIQEKEVEQIPDSDFPDIPEPTESAKKRREKEIEREKKRRIKEGFYQERSDEDDTLEPIRSLKEELTDTDIKKPSNNKNNKKR